MFTLRMGKNLLVINVDIRETRVALIENGIIAELHIERDAQKGTLGNIYLGKVSRVLPGMQAAFIDIGLERAAFLHVEDLIRPDDFDAYLAGRHQHGSGSEDDDRSSASSHDDSARADRDVAVAPHCPLANCDSGGKHEPSSQCRRHSFRFETSQIWIFELESPGIPTEPEK